MNRCLKILGIIVVSILLTGTTQSSDDSVPNELELVWSYKTSSNVESVSISADGSYTAVGSGDKVYLLDRDGKVLWSYETNFPVKYVSISANGNYTAVGDAGKSYPIPKGKAYFLNKEGDLLGTVEGNAVSSVSISEDGSRALTYMHGLGWWDIVIFYPSENETKSWHYTIGWAKTGAVSISENGNYIAVGSAGQGLEKEGIRFYNREGKLLWKYKDIDTGYEPHYSVSISADGSYIIAGNDKNDKVYLLDRDGKLLWSYKTGFVEGISISVDGSYMAVGSGDKVYLLDRNGKFLWSHDINGISSVSISTDGNSIVVGSRDKIVYLFLKVQILAQRTIKNSYEVISQEKSKGVNVKEAETLLYQAENAFKKGDYSKAKEVAKQAESKALEIGKEADDANSLISKAKFAISQEKSKGLIITEAESLLSQAENSFKADDYYKAKKLAEQARDKALEISSTNSAISQANSVISQEKSKGFDVDEAESLLSQAEQAFKTRDYEKASETASNAKALALDIDRDGVINEKDFTPTIKNNYIYTGVFVILLILSILIMSKTRLIQKKKPQAYPFVGAIISGLIGLIISSAFYSGEIIALNMFMFYILTAAFVAVLIGGYVDQIRGTHKWVYINLVIGILSPIIWSAFFPYSSSPAFMYYDTGIQWDIRQDKVIEVFLYIVIPAIIGLVLRAPCRGIISTFLLSTHIPAFLIILFIIMGKPVDDIIDIPIFKIPIFIPITFALAGYGIGKAISKRSIERERYEMRMREYKSKIEQWKAGGYDVSELEEMLK